jgi:hypothetical protein
VRATKGQGQAHTEATVSPVKASGLIGNDQGNSEIILAVGFLSHQITGERPLDNASVGPSRDRRQTGVNGLSGAGCQALMRQKASNGCSLIHIVSGRPHAIAGDRR